MAFKADKNIKNLVPGNIDPKINKLANQPSLDPCKALGTSDIDSMTDAEKIAKLTEIAERNFPHIANFTDKLGPGIDAGSILSGINGGDTDSTTKKLGGILGPNLNKTMNQAAVNLKDPKKLGELAVAAAAGASGVELAGVVTGKVDAYDLARKKIPTKAGKMGDLSDVFKDDDIAMGIGIGVSVARILCNNKVAKESGEVKSVINKSIDKKLSSMTPKEIKAANKTQEAQDKLKADLQTQVEKDLIEDRVAKAQKENLKPLEPISKLEVFDTYADVTLVIPEKGTFNDLIPRPAERNFAWERRLLKSYMKSSLFSDPSNSLGIGYFVYNFPNSHPGAEGTLFASKRANFTKLFPNAVFLKDGKIKNGKDGFPLVPLTMLSLYINLDKVEDETILTLLAPWAIANITGKDISAELYIGNHRPPAVNGTSHLCSGYISSISRNTKVGKKGFRIFKVPSIMFTSDLLKSPSRDVDILQEMSLSFKLNAYNSAYVQNGQPGSASAELGNTVNDSDDTSVLLNNGDVNTSGLDTLQAEYDKIFYNL